MVFRPLLVCPHSAVKVDFFSISYRQLEKQVCHWKLYEKSPRKTSLIKPFVSHTVLLLLTLTQVREPTRTLFDPSGSRWCKRRNGAGLWDSGAGELQTDSDNGRNHLWALHVLENAQRLSGVSSSQVGYQFDSYDNLYSSVKGSDWWLFIWNVSQEMRIQPFRLL